MAKITLKHIQLGYPVKRKDYKVIADDLNIVFSDSKISVIIGQSGCGKTSILRSIAGILTPLSGSIIFDNTDVTTFDPGSRHVSYVSQMIGLYPNLSVFNNIAFPLKASHTPAEEIRERVLEAAEMLKIEHCIARKPRELSVGQAQRVAIARAIVKRSMVYLLDEPFSNLDRSLSHELTIELKELFTRIRATVILVSHDVNEALTIADEVFVMHDGKIIMSGTPEKVLESKNAVVKQLIEANQ